jgi:imidazoleglycerol phosphate dehydratase HisB
LAPIVTGLLLGSDPALQVIISQVGYILIAVAAGMVAADKYFGWSSGWIRYITALLTLQHALATFRLDWSSLLLAVRDVPADRVGREVLQPFIDRARQFQDEVLKVVEQETQAWATEFQSSIADLEQTLTAQREAARTAREKVDQAAKEAVDRSAPGAVTIDLSAQPQGQTEVRVDREKVGDYDTQRIVLMNVAPGMHEIRVKGRRSDGTPFDVPAASAVKPGGETRLAIDI